MNSRDIKKQISGIISNVSNIKVHEEDYDTHLFSPKIDLKPRDLAYVFMEVEETFKISIPERSIIEDGFTTVNKIFTIITDVLYAEKR